MSELKKDLGMTFLAIIVLAALAFFTSGCAARTTEIDVLNEQYQALKCDNEVIRLRYGILITCLQQRYLQADATVDQMIVCINVARSNPEKSE